MRKRALNIILERDFVSSKEWEHRTYSNGKKGSC